MDNELDNPPDSSSTLENSPGVIIRECFYLKENSRIQAGFLKQLLKDHFENNTYTSAVDSMNKLVKKKKKIL